MIRRRVTLSCAVLALLAAVYAMEPVVVALASVGHGQKVRIDSPNP